MGMVDPVLLKALALEVRQAAGIERTPAQVEHWLISRFRRPQSAVRKILDDPDLVQQTAKEMRIPYLEQAPKSDELMD